MGWIGLIACAISAVVFYKTGPSGWAIFGLVLAIANGWSLGIMSNYGNQMTVSNDPGERVAITVNMLASLVGVVLLIAALVTGC